MKEVSKLKSYREKFKRYYGIDFSNKYEVHHIDLNRKNNNIENLVLLPSDLHRKYHFCLGSVSLDRETMMANIDVRIRGNNINYSSYQMEMLENLIHVMNECSVWYDYTLYLAGVLPNIHNIELDHETRDCK